MITQYLSNVYTFTKFLYLTYVLDGGKIIPMYNKIPFVLIGLLVLSGTVSALADDSNKATIQTVKQEHVQLKNAVLKLEKTTVVKKTYKKNEQLSAVELKAILQQVGFKGQALKEAWGTAMKESTGRPMAHNKNSKTGDNSYGLFQINMIGSLGPARLEQYNLKSNEELFDPLTNAKIAYQMSNGGKDWSAWHGITKSTKKWMQEFPG